MTAFQGARWARHGQPVATGAAGELLQFAAAIGWRATHTENGSRTTKAVDAVRFSTCMAQNMDAACLAVAGYLAARTGIALQFVDDVPWQERERRFDRGEIDLCWLCGLPYVRKADDAAAVELLAAPVMRGSRYGGRPVYFSDVVVRQDSPLRDFSDLRGARWAYNEPNSHSGHNVVAHHLASRGLDWQYFASVVESGAHQRSLAMLLAGDIDASAIDSSVLETELRRQPALAGRLRVIATLGPSPAPPLLIRRSVPATVRAALREALLSMAEETAGREVLAMTPFAGFLPVDDRDYDVIRRMRAGAAALAKDRLAA